MVYYITTPEHLGLMQKICEERKMNFEFVTNIKDIKLFVNTEIKKLEHIKFFVIDLDCLDNTDKEVYDSICGMRYMTKAKILIVALGRTTGDSLVNALRERNVCKLILSKDEEQVQKEIESCLSGTETKEAAPQKSICGKNDKSDSAARKAENRRKREKSNSGSVKINDNDRRLRN